MTMTLSISCDECGETFECSTSHDAGCNEIDDSLEEGWLHDVGEDFCPKCVFDRGDDE